MKLVYGFKVTKIGWYRRTGMLKTKSILVIFCNPVKRNPYSIVIRTVATEIGSNLNINFI